MKRFPVHFPYRVREDSIQFIPEGSSDVSKRIHRCHISEEDVPPPRSARKSWRDSALSVRVPNGFNAACSKDDAIWSYFLIWDDQHATKNSPEHLDAVFNHEAVITRDEVQIGQ